MYVYFIADPSEEATGHKSSNDSFPNGQSRALPLDKRLFPLIDNISIPLFERTPTNSTLDNVRMGCLFLSYCNGMLNPLVLLIMSSSVRENLINFRKGASNTDISQTRFHRGASYSHSVVSRHASRQSRNGPHNHNDNSSKLSEENKICQTNYSLLVPKSSTPIAETSNSHEL